MIHPARAVVQERPPAEMRGRVIATQLFLSNTASILPLPLMGGLADVVGMQRVFALLALVALGFGGASLWQARG